MEFQRKDKYSMDDLLEIMKILRAPGGCPWDREQTHQSIRNCFIEETYEAVEAIDTEDPVLLQEELGDVLLQVLFHLPQLFLLEKLCVFPCHKAAFAGLGIEKAFPFQLFVGTLCGDNTDPQFLC